MPKQRYIKAPGSRIYHLRAPGLLTKTAACGQKFRFVAAYKFPKSKGIKTRTFRLCRKCRRAS